MGEKRYKFASIGDGAERWATEFIGSREAGSAPRAYLIEMPSRDVVLPHFHEVDQFQIFVAGGGLMGKKGLSCPVTVHYADRYTGYGPITAGPQGCAYFTFRAEAEPGPPIYLHKPGYRDKLRPSLKRQFLLPLTLSIEPVLMQMGSQTLESIIESGGGSSGPEALVLRAGSMQPICGPSVVDSGGQFYLILNGSLEFDAISYAKWSIFFVGPNDPPLQARASASGVEALVLQFGGAEK